jgi:hypothetical protein
MSAAASRYLANHDRLGHLIKVLADAWNPIQKANDAIRPLVAGSKAGDAVDKELDRLIAEAEPLSKANEFAFEWYLVVAVTFAEAYLEDILSAAAVVDPKLMEKSTQSASYNDVLEAASVNELADALRRRWARNFIEGGGPARWIERLTAMGAPGFPDGLASRLEQLWGLRHVVVHAAGRVTPEFAKRHPGLGYRPGDSLSVTSRATLHYIGDVASLVDVTDAFFCNRLPGLATAPIVRR